MPTLARLSLALLAGLTFAQTPAPLKFEVASIKPRHLDRALYWMPDTKLTGINGSTYKQDIINVRHLLVDAFAVKNYQVVGLPAWAESNTDMFEIIAKVEGGRTPTAPEVRRMLQSLLADRFNLRFHREKRNIPVYALVRGKVPPKLEPSAQGI